MATVRLDNVRKVYAGNVVAVESASLMVAEKEFLVLVGPSGCGKTTTLRMVAGLEEVTSGQIHIEDRLVNDVHPKDRDIAMVFQNYALYPHMTVRQNMSFGLKLRRMPRKEVEHRVAEAARILELPELLDRKPSALSGGQRQRVAVGRAIVRDPAVFLFDEPLSNLDAKLRVEMRAELKKLHAKIGTTMIYVTHDQVEAMTLGDRIAVMNEGHIHQVAPPLTIYDSPADTFVARFMGTPPMNCLDGELCGEPGTLAWTNGQWSVPLRPDIQDAIRPLAGQKAILGIRPENVHFADDGAADGPDLTGIVDVVELLGDEQLIHITAGDCALMMKGDAHRRIEAGADVQVVLAPDKVHVFDGDTGRNRTVDFDRVGGLARAA